MGLFRTITSPFFLSFSPSALDSASDLPHRTTETAKKKKKAEFRQQHWNELEEILLPSRTGYTVRTDNHWVPDGKIQPSSLIVRGASG
jgi:hypothetical protein